MRVVILADTPFLKREREMLMRLEVGLADEGVRVIHAVPIEMLADAAGVLYSTVVGYESRGLPITRSSRAARLASDIQQQTDQDDLAIDVVHVFAGGLDSALSIGSRLGSAGLALVAGSGAWGMGLELCKLARASLMVELWDAASVPGAATLAKRRIGVRPIEFSVPEAGLRRLLRRRASSSSVHVAPWGVHAPPQVPILEIVPSDDSGSPRPLAIAILTEGKDPSAVRACLGALATLSDRGVPLMLFAGTSLTKLGRDPAVWAAARQFNLLDRLSLVPDMEARRDPVLDMDVLLLPEAAGRQRTLVLDAMAQGVVVVAAKDEWVECLMGEAVEDAGPTAAIVPDPSEHAWLDTLAALLPPAGPGAEPSAGSRLFPRAEQLRSRAHQFVRSSRSASAQVAAVLTAYNTLVAASEVGVKM
jgi:hypothetical protein